MRNSFSFITLFIGLFLGIAISIWSFSEPSDTPPNCVLTTPGCNEPLNASATAQTKSGDITIKNLILGAGGSQGDITQVNEIRGVDDIILRGAPGNGSPIYIEGKDVIINNDAGSGNVQIGGAANPPYKLTIAGGGGILGVDNTAAFLAKNTAGTYETFVIPRDNTNKMKLFTGVAGLEIRDNGDANSRLFVGNSGTGNVGIGTAVPGASLEIVAPGGANPTPSQTLRLKKTAGVAGSVDLFVAIGSAGGQTGTVACTTVTAQATCLAYWDSGGTNRGCGSNRANGRALCVDFGD